MMGNDGEIRNDQVKKALPAMKTHHMSRRKLS